LLLDYQPIVDLASHSIVALEALVRWLHPVRGLLYPREFIPLAERTGLIVPIGLWVLERACATRRGWGALTDTGAPRINVNLSTRQFQQPDIVSQVDQILQQTGLKPGLLELEITESAMIRDVNEAAETLRALHTLGVRLALDDFGVGFASLYYLHQYPADTLKIDQSLIGSPVPSAESWTVVESLVRLAHELNMDAIVEGIETEEQLKRARATGCDWGQGYHLYAPMHEEAIAGLLSHLD